ncbi:ATPase, FliI/YscN family [Desulfonatronospira thiodismutans ASO3-1]|uniref:ATPase, FliI/YscN family n=1 Tax=Desulfonatronospira thiodismutans ASO3-1 TaxID=555779 RepID=D6STA2_9BACT|nr:MULTISPECIES: FliI/YscN family ATPase [Desulfonatronospira]EFI33918.1 ATPase, FliI/YscN family [Desulfonatronospira thiodismutans ASO3-1]RQD72976.1 MAG: FliI/YscN family ATPase [Desulfonatronospira sp. MSAO_Bac3]
MSLDAGACLDLVRDMNPVMTYGKVTKVVGLVVEGRGLKAPLGAICQLLPDEAHEDSAINAEVVGFRDGAVLFMPYGDMRGIKPGSLIRNSSMPPLFPVGSKYLGKAVDAFGTPLEDDGSIIPQKYYPLYAAPLNPMQRPRIDEPLDVGIKSINSLLTLGKGQRVGIMAGSGVGKSTAMGMMARYTEADVNVIALVGERGREVLEFIDKDLGPEGMARSVLVVATSDQGPLIRMRAAYAATAMAEYFRDQGKDVLLMMDSVTRFAMAAREVGLAAGEPPTTRGYTPTVFSHLPKLLERTGKSGKGSITGIYTVLVEGDDFNEPVADAVRSILDGHIVLTRELADQGHFPAIDVLKSVSRLRKDVTPEDVVKAGQKVIRLLAAYEKVEDMINIGAYVKGSNQEIDQAVRLVRPINDFLRQDIEEKFTLQQSFQQMQALLHLDESGPGSQAQESAQTRKTTQGGSKKKQAGKKK